MKKKRRVSWVIWLSNFTDSRDDDWVVVKAINENEAKLLAEYDKSRFSIVWAKKGTQRQIVGV